MDLGKAIVILLTSLVVVWLFVLTYTINNSESMVTDYTEQIDSLTNRVQKLEYYIEHQQPCTLVVNVNELKTSKTK